MKIFVQADKAGETFRVFILMPLLPAFEGDVSGDSGTGIGMSQNKCFRSADIWNVSLVRHADNYALPVPVNLARVPFSYPTSSKGGLSLSKTRKIPFFPFSADVDVDLVFLQGVDNWKNFIGFYSLRSYDMLQVNWLLNGRVNYIAPLFKGVPVSELVYIHSKLLIADDQVTNWASKVKVILSREQIFLSLSKTANVRFIFWGDSKCFYLLWRWQLFLSFLRDSKCRHLRRFLVWLWFIFLWSLIQWPSGGHMWFGQYQRSVTAWRQVFQKYRIVRCNLHLVNAFPI